MHCLKNHNRKKFIMAPLRFSALGSTSPLFCWSSYVPWPVATKQKMKKIQQKGAITQRREL